jgi:hypothetical protein
MLLTLTTNELRSAVRSENFGEADRLLIELRREVEMAWAAAGQAERQSLAKEVLEVLDWAKVNVLVRRSHLQHKLVQIRREGAYHASRTRGSRRLELVG